MTQERSERYDPEYIAEVNKSVNLLEYAKLSFDFEERSGNYFTHCPSTTHQDDTPSLCINPERNMFKCFACGAGGGIINWLRFVEHLSFDEAVKKAAQIGNVKQVEGGYRSETIIINRELARAKNQQTHIQHQILDRKIYNQYAKEIPNEWLEEGISRKAMLRYNIRIDNEKQRIVYPVLDAAGEFINIKGRTRQKFYKELKIPKYINYFKSGTIDYFQGWQQALPFVKEKGEIILFEGIKSCMKAYDYGYPNTVSVESHSINIEQAKLLIKLGADVVVAFDSDVDPTEISGLETVRRFLNVDIISNPELLGEKNAPVDKGKEVWERLYMERYRI